MPFISPSDPRLRRLHRIDPAVLAEKASIVGGNAGMEPVSIVKFRQPTGNTVLIVADGTHRVQAALEANLTEIEFSWGKLSEVEREAKRRGHNFDDLAHRARGFSRDDYE